MRQPLIIKRDRRNRYRVISISSIESILNYLFMIVL